MIIEVNNSARLYAVKGKTMKDFYSQFHPKPRAGKECKKVSCERYKDYLAWNPGTNNLKFCMECKHAHRSQYRSGKIINEST